jgi:hypothetical protein
VEEREVVRGGNICGEISSCKKTKHLWRDSRLDFPVRRLCSYRWRFLASRSANFSMVPGLVKVLWIIKGRR